MVTTLERHRAWRATPRGHKLRAAGRHKYRRLHPESERRRRRRRAGWPDFLLDVPTADVSRAVLAAWRRWSRRGGGGILGYCPPGARRG